MCARDEGLVEVINTPPLLGRPTVLAASRLVVDLIQCSRSSCDPTQPSDGLRSNECGTLESFTNRFRRF